MTQTIRFGNHNLEIRSDDSSFTGLIPNDFQHNAEILFQVLFNLAFRSKY